MKKGKLKGYKGITLEKGKFVAAEDAFDYVCKQVGIAAFYNSAPEAAEFKEMLIEWYFSGNWIEVYEDG
jgi:hypothetical protein